MKPILASVAVAALGTLSQAQNIVHQCWSDVCFSLNIPEDTASSGSGDVYFQISGPTSRSWISFGQGQGMTDSAIYVVYTDGKGNVTLSPRKGIGHVDPTPERLSNLTLLEGSGVTNGRMVANVRCSNCERWDGGTTDFTSSSGDWFYASRSGPPMDSTELDAEIEEHNEDHEPFTCDYASAQGGSSLNPFLARDGTAGGSGGSGTGSGVSPAPSSPSSSAPAGGDSDAASGPSVATINAMTAAHGAIAAVTFLVLFPAGSFVLRIPGLGIWFHAAIQIFSYCCFITAAGIGIYLANMEAILSNYHPIVGIIVLGLLTFQPLWGVLHHLGFKSKQRRTGISYVHIWLGRIAVILGMINGRLGIRITGIGNVAGEVTKGYTIAYMIVVAVMGTLFIASAVYGELRGSRRKSTASDSINS